MLTKVKILDGYAIQTSGDETIGRVKDVYFDDRHWTIRYLVVNTSNWWAGKKVLISPLWIERVSWSEQRVVINLTRDTIKLSPEFTDESLLTRDYEINLYGHYNRKGYWVDELVAS